MKKIGNGRSLQWGFAKQIMPLLAIGVVTAGFLLGSTHDNTAIAGIIRTVG